ncbi:DUF58 domain-containing protein [Clostridium sp.]|uniref:DUF58 domain-containing protein n=1 Tax=Clostridium sp. TaxID=1506 RepID=UPI0034648062
MPKIKISLRFIIIFIIVTCFSYFQGDYIANSIFYGFLILLIISLIFNCILYKSIIININPYDRSICSGEDIDIKLTIFNKGFFPVNYMVLHNKGISDVKKDLKGQCISLNIGEKKEIEYNLTFLQRGVYDIGDFHITLKGIFSIVEITFTMKKEESIFVYPRIYEIGEGLNFENILVEGIVNKNSLKEDLYSIKDLRQYVIGDRLKDINWKVTAKGGELYVKTFDNTLGEDVDLFINMNKGNYSLDSNGGLEEKLIDFSLSLIKIIIEEDLEVTLRLNNKEGYRDIINRGTFSNIYNDMMFKFSNGETEFKDFLEYLEDVKKSDYKIIIYYYYCDDKIKSYIDNYSIRALSFKDILKKGGAA